MRSGPSLRAVTMRRHLPSTMTLRLNWSMQSNGARDALAADAEAWIHR